MSEATLSSGSYPNVASRLSLCGLLMLSAILYSRDVRLTSSSIHDCNFYNSSPLNMTLKVNLKPLHSQNEALVEVFSLSHIWIDVVVILSMILFGFWCLVMLNSCLYPSTHLKSSRLYFNNKNMMVNGSRNKQKTIRCAHKDRYVRAVFSSVEALGVEEISENNMKQTCSP